MAKRTGQAAPPAEAPKSEGNGNPPASGKKYNMISLNVSSGRVTTKKALTDLAAQLSCRVSDLVWSAIDALLASPPTSKPAGAQAPRAGTAAGYWVVHNVGPKGLTGIKIVEVTSRAQVTGRTFYRFTADNAKSKALALKQAQRSAQYDAQIAGLKLTGPVEVEQVS